MAKKKLFGGRSLSSFRKSVGLDKDKSKASTTKQERDKNIKEGYQEKEIKKLTQVDTTGGDTVLSLSRGDPISNFKAQETPSTFVKDLKNAYKSGLFTGGTKTKDFMDKYNLDPSDIVKLRVGIDQGLGTRIGGQEGNILTDIVNDLQLKDILTYRGASRQALYDKAQDIFEPGMTKYDREPMTGLMGLSPVANLGIKGMDLIAGGSSQGLRGLVYGRDVLGLTGEDLDNFAASVANDNNLYNQMMTTPKMQEYELNEFRAEANKNAMAQRRGGDPDPISGSQGGEGEEGGESGDGTTDPGTDPVYTPPPQNYFTFFDPNLGRYRSGTYDEYLQYVTAKDGGIIQLQQGGTDEDPIANAPGGVLPQGRKEQLEALLTSLQEISDIKPNPKFSSEQEGKTMLMDDVNKKMNELLRNIKGNPTTVGLSGEAVKMAEEDQPAKGILNIEIPSDSGPALREDLSPLGRVGDSGLSLLMEALRKSDITEGSANQFIEEALNNFVAAGIIPPNTSYDQLTDPFKDLVTREASMIAKSENMKQEINMVNPTPISDRRPVNPDINDQIDDMMRDQYMNQLYNQALEYQMEKEQDGSTTIRDPRTGQITGFNVADGGIINLKDGGMNDMMAADSLMFKDPSDEGEWEYNV